jgi:CRP-like cAMP-binding protein
MSQDTPSMLATLRGARLFRGTEAAVLESLAREARLSSLREGERLWHAGQEARVFSVIQRGLVLIERSVNGREPAVLGIFGPRESVGTSAALGRTAYPADAIASSEQVRVVSIPGEAVLRAMELEPTLARSVQQALLEHTHALTTKIDIVSAGSVNARLATLLLHLSERFGDERDDGTVWIPLTLSRTCLGRLVSARVETVIRALGRMRKEGVLRLESDGIVLCDSAALQELARQA